MRLLAAHLLDEVRQVGSLLLRGGGNRMKRISLANELQHILEYMLDRCIENIPREHDNLPQSLRSAPSW